MLQDGWIDQRAPTVDDTTEAKEPTSMYTPDTQINKLLSNY